MTDCRQYVLLELGGMPEAHRKQLQQRLNLYEHAYLFADTPEEKIKHLGPLLVEADAVRIAIGETDANWELLPRLNVVYVEAVSSLASLAEHLRNRLTVVLPDGESRLFRFYDSEVFEALCRELDNSQYFDFWRPLKTWRTRTSDMAWRCFEVEADLRAEPSSVFEESPPPPGLKLPAGHFRLNWSIWNELRFKADMRQIRMLCESSPNFQWFSHLEPTQQQDIFDDLVYRPLRESGMLGLSDLHAAAVLAMSYPLHDVWGLDGVLKAIRDAKAREGTFRDSLARHVSADTWAELEEIPDGPI
jgi:hypothetical protein